IAENGSSTTASNGVSTSFDTWVGEKTEYLITKKALSSSDFYEKNDIKETDLNLFNNNYYNELVSKFNSIYTTLSSFISENNNVYINSSTVDVFNTWLVDVLKPLIPEHSDWIIEPTKIGIEVDTTTGLLKPKA
ncbi:MAG: hypothetical protein HRS57_01715, partial [Mycoplasmataceae bacterium]|nr:hypothetical protein [Mycoplasmataceae bacterium]